MKKHVLVAASLITIGAAGIGSTALAHAATSTNMPSNSTAVHKRLNRRQIRVEARLNQAVRDGVISTEQKSAFLTELKTLKEERKTDGITKSSTAAQRQSERTKLRNELESWANANNFPLGKIMPKISTSQQ